jgi:hypothetical protein
MFCAVIDRGRLTALRGCLYSDSNRQTQLYVEFSLLGRGAGTTLPLELCLQHAFMPATVIYVFMNLLEWSETAADTTLWSLKFQMHSLWKSIAPSLPSYLLVQNHIRTYLPTLPHMLLHCVIAPLPLPNYYQTLQGGLRVFLIYYILCSGRNSIWPLLGQMADPVLSW